MMNALRRHAAMAVSTGARWDPRFDTDSAFYLPKWKSDAFCNPALDQLLAENQIEQLALAGLKASACVTATVKSALARGLRVQLLADAIACRTDASRDAALNRLARQGAELVRSSPIPASTQP
jgi:nicotinamidase-related amidase